MLLRMFCASLATFVCLATAASGSTVASASTAGVAYDSVTKLVSSGDPPLRSEDFAADFRAGQRPTDNCTPSLIRRYVTTRKERIEDVCKQEATIVDCDTRTATLLDFARKAYGVVSLDAPVDDGLADFSALADKTKSTSTIAIERVARGPVNVGGILTHEFTTSYEQSFISGILNTTSRDRWRYYFATTPLPKLACIDVAAPWLSRYGTPQRYEPELQRYFEARLSRSRSSRPRITESGPQLPSWRIVLYSVWDHFQHQVGAADSQYFFELESGNRRSIDDNDPAFTPPSGYTKLPS